MSKKTSPIKGPPQKTTTKALGPTKPVGGGVVVPYFPTEKPTPEDVKILPEKMPELPRRINGNDLMKRWNKRDFEIIAYVKEGLLNVYYHSGELIPKDSPYLRINEYLIFDLSEVEELEKKHPELLIGKVATRSAGQDEANKPLAYEDFIRKLRVSYETDSEIKIQELRRTPVTYNCKRDIRFQDETTEAWKAFLDILQNPDHTYTVGPAYTYSPDGSQKIKERNKSYDRNQKRLEEINKKLIDFFNKHFQVQIPEDYKLYELSPRAGAGVYGFKFQVIDSDTFIGKISSRYNHYTQDQLLDEIEKLTAEHEIYIKELNSNDIPKAQINKLRLAKDEIEKKLSDASLIAFEKKWLTDFESDKMLLPDKDQEEIVYDPHENEEDLKPNY